MQHACRNVTVLLPTVRFDTDWQGNVILYTVWSVDALPCPYMTLALYKARIDAFTHKTPGNESAICHGS